MDLVGTTGNIFSAICQLMYFSNAIFIMISGALFLNPDKDISIKKLYSKYILRMVIALFLFGGFYSILETYYNTQTLSMTMISEAIKNIFTGNLWAHMWYLYLIIGLYMITPLLKKFICNCSRNEYRYILILLFIFTILFTDISKILKTELAFNILIISPYIFFYMLGDYLSRYDISKKLKFANYIFSLISIILIIVNNFVNIFDNELVTFTSTMISSIIISIFLIAKNKKENFGEKTKNVLEDIEKCGLGIYLIHQLIINIIYKILKVDFILNYPYIGLIIYTLVIFAISYLITYFLRKIKIVKNYIL